MKKIPKEEIYQFRRVRIFKEDIKTIYGILKEKYPVLKLTVGGYELDDATELDELKERKADKLTLKCLEKEDGPWAVELDLAHNYASLVVKEIEKIENRGIFEKIKEVVKKRELLVSGHLAWLFFLILVIASSYLTITTFVTSVTVKGMAWVLSFLIGSAASLLHVGMDEMFHSEVILTAKPTLFRKVKDDLIEKLPSLIAGGIITTIVCILIPVRDWFLSFFK